MEFVSPVLNIFSPPQSRALSLSFLFVRISLPPSIQIHPLHIVRRIILLLRQYPSSQLFLKSTFPPSIFSTPFQVHFSSSPTNSSSLISLHLQRWHLPPSKMGLPILRFSLEPFLRQFFFLFGTFVHRHRWPMVLVPPLISACLSVGFIWFNELAVDDPAYVFTPRDARWKRELGTFARLWPLEENKFIPGKSFETKRFVNVLCKAKDGGNVLRPAILDEIELLNKFIAQNITVPTGDGRFELSYQDLCLSYDWQCPANEHIQMFKQMAQMKRNVELPIDLTYPKGGNKDTPAYLGTAIGDIKLNKTDGTVLEAKITQLFFFLKQEPANVRQYSTDFEYAAERFLLHGFESSLISVSFMHYQSLEDGLDENARRFVPNFVTSFIALTIFCIACAFTFRHNRRTSIDWIRSKPYVACAGLLTTLLSLLSAFGLLMLLGVPYNVINTIIPFLIIAVGIDDMFVMNACWAHSDPSLPVSERMAQMMRDGGVAVSITNVTDILAFLIGCVTELPGIELFCLYAFLSVLFCYIYQLTFFAGAMAIMGEAERERRHCIFLYKIAKSQIVPTKTISNGKLPPFAGPIPTKMDKSHQFVQTIRIDHPPPKRIKKPKMDQMNISHHFFAHYFGPFLLHNAIRALVCVSFFGYIFLALLGCMHFREGLEPEHLVTGDHYIGKYFEDMKVFWKSGAQLHVAILNPPNFTDPFKRQQLLETVAAFENTPYTMGREGTVFFFLEFLNYLEQLNAEPENTERIWGQKMRSWLKFTGASNQWDTDIAYYEKENGTLNGNGRMKAFRFQVAMKDIVEPNQHKLTAKLLREIADRQPFHVEIYHEMFPFADQYLIILPSTIRNVLISLLCMTAIAFLLIPSIPSAMLIVLSIISIATGVFGYMTFWGVNLDAVSMISIIMSIGFAVDLSAHIVYAFVTAKGDNPKERVIGALGHIGWPIFQGAASTIMGISVLYTVDAYIILTFFKTIWLTMVLGLVHGLIFIPVLLSFLPMGFFQLQNLHQQTNESKC